MYGLYGVGVYIFIYNTLFGEISSVSWCQTAAITIGIEYNTQLILIYLGSANDNNCNDHLTMDMTSIVIICSV